MKRPAFQFYPGDWLRDTALRSCSLEARGLWIELLCYMHDGAPYGHLAVAGEAIHPRKLAKMVGLPFKRFTALLRELERAKVFNRTDGGTIYSRRMVRDEQLRGKRAAGGPKSLGHPNVPRPKDIPKEPQEGVHEGPPERGDGGRSPASAVAAASAESQLHGGAPRRAETHGDPNAGDPGFGALMGLVRRYFYVPDGKPPADWDESRDGSILKQLLKQRRPDDVAAAIEGVALLRDHPGAFGDPVDWLVPGAKLTLRVLYNTKSGVVPMYELARQAYWKHANSRSRPTDKQPIRIGDVLREASSRGEGRP